MRAVGVSTTRLSNAVTSPRTVPEIVTRPATATTSPWTVPATFTGPSITTTSPTVRPAWTRPVHCCGAAAVTVRPATRRVTEPSCTSSTSCRCQVPSHSGVAKTLPL